jgi:hypothetical protein
MARSIHTSCRRVAKSTLNASPTSEKIFSPAALTGAFLVRFARICEKSKRATGARANEKMLGEFVA